MELAAFTSRTIISRPELRAAIEEVRAQGWYYVAGELEEPISGLSVPVLDAAGKAVVALNVSANVGRVDRDTMLERFLPELEAARRQMEDQLRLRR